MKTVIKTIQFVRLRNEAHLDFLIIVLKLLDKFTDVKTLVLAFHLQLAELVEQEKKLVDAARDSAYTQQLVEADDRVDNDLMGIKSAVESGTRHFDPAVKAAANIVAKRLKNFGDIKIKSYETESAAVLLLLEDFKGSLAEQVATLGLSGWVAELEAAETAFTELYERRNTENASRPQENLKVLRPKAGEVYGQITYVINADMMVNGEATCGEFVRELNEQVKHFNEQLAYHPSKRDIAEATVDSIPDQPLVPGKPATPIPTLRYADKEETVELRFAKDFTVKYKNNEKVGNASLTIAGCGEFEGKKTVTFGIIKN
jgi:hypothetical protein